MALDGRLRERPKGGARLVVGRQAENIAQRFDGSVYPVLALPKGPRLPRFHEALTKKIAVDRTEQKCGKRVVWTLQLPLDWEEEARCAGAVVPIGRVGNAAGCFADAWWIIRVSAGECNLDLIPIENLAVMHDRESARHADRVRHHAQRQRRVGPNERLADLVGQARVSDPPIFFDAQPSMSHGRIGVRTDCTAAERRATRADFASTAP